MINGFRFIIGSGCNYNCFFCQHEVYEKDYNLNYDIDSLKTLKSFAIKNNIKDISITGGEPFLYFEKLKKLLSIFNPEEFKITLNTNASLIDVYQDYLKDLHKIEFHVNLSSLDKTTHRRIIGVNFLEREINNLKLLKELGHDICLNIPVLKTINDDELTDMFYFCISNQYKPRFLVLYNSNGEIGNYVMDIDEIMNQFTNARLSKAYGYGRYDIESDEGNFEIVRCLCAKHECEKCRDNTFIHFTPELNMKYCMESEEEIPIDYQDEHGIENGHKIFTKKLNNIVRREKI